MHITKMSAGRLAEVLKSSDHEEGQRVAFFLKGVTVDTDEQGDPITAPVVIEAMDGVAPKEKAVLPNGARVAINALQEAIGDLGVIPPASNHIPPATRAVTTDQWRTYAYKRGISTSDQPRAQQMAFETSRETIAGREGNRDLGTACMDRVRPASHGAREMFALCLKAGNLGTQTMTETTALTRALVDLCTMTGRLDLGVWADFKTAHVVEAQQIEPVLVETIGHLCTLSRELTEEVGRLSHALAWRGR